MANKKAQKVETVEEQPKKQEEVQTENPTPEPVGTSQQLFPDFFEQPAEEKVEEKEEVKEEVEEGPNDSKVEESQDDFIDLETFGEKKFKAVVDGEEKVVTFKDLVKGYQTDQHLSKKGNKLGEERKQLEELLAEVNKAKELPKENVSEQFDDDVDPSVSKLQKQLAEVQKQLASQNELLADTREQKAVNQIDSYLTNKKVSGFKEMWPEVKRYMKEEMTPQEQQQMDNAQGYMNVFLMLKANKPSEKSQEPVVEKPEPKKVKIVKLDNPTSTAPSQDDDFGVRYKAAKEEAMRTGDWSQVFSLKGY